MVARRAIPSADHIMRYVQKSRQHRDPDTDEFLGLAPGAFMLGPKDEGGMSVSWIEFFGPLSQAAKKEAAIAFRESLDRKKLGGSAVFATAQVQAVLDAGKAFSKQLRVVYAPVPGNDGHAEVRHFSDDDLELLDWLASAAFLEIDHVAGMGLPKR